MRSRSQGCSAPARSTTASRGGALRAVSGRNGSTRWLVLVLVWTGATLGLVLELAWLDSPRWLKAIAYMAVGWVGVLVAPQLFAAVGVASAILLVAGGALYTIGAVVYASKWPNPLPRTLGFHEVFHLLVVCAAVTQFVAVALIVM